MSADAACLRCIGSVDLDELSTSFFRFAGQLGEKGRPCRITYRLGKTMIMQHPVHVQVLDTDDSKAVNNLSGLLMCEVLPLELDTLVNSCNSFAMLATFGRSLHQLRVLSLDTLQRLLFLAKETGIGNLFCIGERGKRLESHVYPYLCIERVKTLRVALTRKGDVPLAGTALVKSCCLDGATDRPMIHYLDTSNLGERDMALMGDAKAALGVRETIIASVTLEAWVAWLFTCFYSAKERFHGKVNAHRHILQNLGMNGSEGRTLFFQHRIGSLLPIARQTLPFLLIRILAVLKQVVVEPSALFKSIFKRFELFVGWKNPILKVLYHVFIVAQFTQIAKFSLNARVLPFIPMSRSQRLSDNSLVKQ